VKQVNHSILRKAAAFALAGVMALSLAACGVTINPADTSATGTKNQTPSSSNTVSGVQTANNTPTDKPGQTALIALYPGYADLPVGFTVCLDCQLKDKNQPVEWSSSNPAAASVDADGKITGVAPGEAVITATLKNDPTATATCGVYVEDTERKTVIAWEQEPQIKPQDMKNKSQEELQNMLKDDGNTDTTENSNTLTEANSEYPLEIDPGEGITEITFNESEMKKILEKEIVWGVVIYDHKDTLSEQEPPIKYATTLMLAAQKKGGNTPFGQYDRVLAAGFWTADTSDFMKATYMEAGGEDAGETDWDYVRSHYTYTLWTIEANGPFNNSKEINSDLTLQSFMEFKPDPTFKGTNKTPIYGMGHSVWEWKESFEEHKKKFPRKLRSQITRGFEKQVTVNVPPRIQA